MTQEEFDILMDNSISGGYCPICGLREIYTNGFCYEHQGGTIRYTNLADLNWGKKKIRKIYD